MSGFFKLNPRKILVLLFLVVVAFVSPVFSRPVLAGGGALSGGMEQVEEGDDFLIEEDGEKSKEERPLTNLPEERDNRAWLFGLAGLAGFGLGFYALYRRRH